MEYKVRSITELAEGITAKHLLDILITSTCIYPSAVIVGNHSAINSNDDLMANRIQAVNILASVTDDETNLTITLGTGTSIDASEETLLAVRKEQVVNFKNLVKEAVKQYGGDSVIKFTNANALVVYVDNEEHKYHIAFEKHTGTGGKLPETEDEIKTYLARGSVAAPGQGISGVITSGKDNSMITESETDTVEATSAEEINETPDIEDVI